MRPLPPLDALEEHSAAFFPDQLGLGAWAHETFIDEEAPLCNEEHAHLRSAQIGWLWTNALNIHRGQNIVGEARLLTPPQERWGKSMFDWQVRQWFGFIPDFLIIISAPYALEADDTAFCALIEHELLHCAQAIDAFGSPRFRRDGTPIFAMRPHDVQEFVSVVERYGPVGMNVARMVAAANERPSVPAYEIAEVCGSCVFRRAA